VATKLQIIYEMRQNPTFSLMNDGTEVKRITTNAKLVCLPQTVEYTASGVHIVDKPVLRTLPVSTLKNHTSQAQFDDWTSMWRDFFDTYARFSGIETSIKDWRIFLQKLKGLITDHASDQKCLFSLFFEWKKVMERESRGADTLAAMDEEEVLERLAKDIISRDEPEKTLGRNVS
jgi:hypothetical protein